MSCSKKIIGQIIKQKRKNKKPVFEFAIKKIHSNLELPKRSEGFQEIYNVKIKNKDFIVKEI